MVLIDKQLMLRILTNYFRRHTANNHIFFYTLYNCCICSNNSIVSNFNLAKHLCSCRYSYSVAYHRWFRIKCISNRNLLVNPTITSDSLRTNICCESMLYE